MKNFRLKEATIGKLLSQKNISSAAMGRYRRLQVHNVLHSKFLTHMLFEKCEAQHAKHHIRIIFHFLLISNDRCIVIEGITIYWTKAPFPECRRAVYLHIIYKGPKLLIHTEMPFMYAGQILFFCITESFLENRKLAIHLILFFFLHVRPVLVNCTSI
jgi:hypothetical protein